MIQNYDTTVLGTYNIGKNGETDLTVFNNLEKDILPYKLFRKPITFCPLLMKKVSFDISTFYLKEF